MNDHRPVLPRLLPFLRWPAVWAQQGLRGDLIAGISVALVMVPQSLAYAQLAGFPPQYGLYAAMLPAIVAALFGSCAFLSTGAVALTGMLTAASLSPLAPGGSPAFIALGVTLALVAGLIQLLLGLLRQGWVLNLFSRPVFSGFTNAATLLICFSQLPILIGAPGQRSSHLADEFMRIANTLMHPHLPTLGFGLATLAALLLLRRFAPRLPGVLIVVVAALAASDMLGFAATGGAVVGHVPRALPHLGWPPLPDWDTLGNLLPVAFVVALVSFLEAAASAKRLSDQAGAHWDENQELIGQGLGKLAAALSGTLPTSASFSRSALNFSTGARTGLSQLITAGLVVAATVSLAHQLYALPKAVLAAIILHAVGNLFDRRAMARAWHVDRDDGVAAWVTFAATLVFAPNIQNGILTGLLLSLSLLIWRSMKPRIALLGLHEDGTYRDLERFDLAHPHPRMTILRFDGALHFVNAVRFTEAVDWARRAQPEVAIVLLSGAGINAIDSTGLDALAQVTQRMHDAGQTLAICGLKKQVVDVLERDALWRQLAPHAAYRHEQAAIEALRPLLNPEKTFDNTNLHP
ncbi:SulP family inorganic anion transporter [Nitrogeniibacter mangrovi]|uniref:SulP family inorganic anion transporter n=1 Tax=Nitrogeniibacter mangrovi TaxID=2016596 RepID=A0A6C1B4W1_9RHOO|nr:SulP family inorganic anion transporter [Nitrogeniibacter mangrovi]QID18722.1 SulP family inorganic anion transporter [Nitrogeniibacter mangrovi]